MLKSNDLLQYFEMFFNILKIVRVRYLFLILTAARLPTQGVIPTMFFEQNDKANQ